MLRSLNFDDSAEIAAIIAFVITFGAFLVIVWRTLRMKQRKVDRMANLPLEDHDRPPPPKDSTS